MLNDLPRWLRLARTAVLRFANGFFFVVGVTPTVQTSDTSEGESTRFDLTATPAPPRRLLVSHTILT